MGLDLSSAVVSPQVDKAPRGESGALSRGSRAQGDKDAPSFSSLLQGGKKNDAPKGKKGGGDDDGPAKVDRRQERKAKANDETDTPAMDPAAQGNPAQTAALPLLPGQLLFKAQPEVTAEQTTVADSTGDAAATGGLEGGSRAAAGTGFETGAGTMEKAGVIGLAASGLAGVATQGEKATGEAASALPTLFSAAQSTATAAPATVPAEALATVPSKGPGDLAKPGSPTMGAEAFRGRVQSVGAENPLTVGPSQLTKAAAEPGGMADPDNADGTTSIAPAATAQAAPTSAGDAAVNAKLAEVSPAALPDAPLATTPAQLLASRVAVQNLPTDVSNTLPTSPQAAPVPQTTVASSGEAAVAVPAEKGKAAGNAGAAITAFMGADKLRRSKLENSDFTLGNSATPAAGTVAAKIQEEMHFPALTSYSMELPADMTEAASPEGDESETGGIGGTFSPTLHAAGTGGENLVHGTKEAAPTRPVDPTQALAKLHEIARAVSSNGPQAINLEVKLDDGGPVQVRVELQNGEVRMTLKQASPELQKALEQSWPAFRREASASGLPVGEIRFERSGGSADSTFQNPAGQQQREGQQAGRSADETGYQPNRRRPTSSPNTTTVTTNKPAPTSRPGTSFWA